MSIAVYGYGYKMDRACWRAASLSATGGAWRRTIAVVIAAVIAVLVSP